ncbi:hypothetical protein LSTR_LSTR015537 [Laodelphax striatellus]|uniref:Uncharacterized protein n=1 Tax=Laodelphax striatellus TaxID=195883 RepID=A0A482XF59_LAOST|nr:hypothetical protein LSTR_LSTR015537 [Laodelphax striatellus]
MWTNDVDEDSQGCRLLAVRSLVDTPCRTTVTSVRLQVDHDASVRTEVDHAASSTRKEREKQRASRRRGAMRRASSLPRYNKVTVKVGDDV